MRIIDNGPWFVEEWKDNQVVIQSEDFHFDSALIVTGDFESYEVKVAYAEEVCRRLNLTNQPN